MGKTPSPGKWIKSLLGKKSSKSSLEKGSEISAKKEEHAAKVVKDNNNRVSNLLTNPTPVASSQEVAATQTLLVPEQQPSRDIEGDEPNANLESGNDTEELKLEEAAKKVQAAVRSHQAREEFQKLKGVIKLQAVIRGHLVRRQAVATYSCIWGIVKFQAFVRGKNARSSETRVQLQKTNTETESSETLQGTNTCSWLENPTKLSMIDKDPNSAKVWLERWTQLQVWAPGPLVVKSLVPKSQTKKRSFQAVEADKGKLKRGIKKPPGGLNTGTSSSSRSTAENEKPKRTVRKPSTLGKELNDNKSKQSSRRSTSAIKEGSSLEAPLSNGVEKHTRKSAEKKKKEIVDSVPKELPGDKASASVVDTPEEEEEKVKDSPETRDDKAEEEIQEPDVLIITSENGNVVSEDTKPSDRRASLPAKIDEMRGGQGSPRIGGQEKPEKNGTTRRHSLPHIANNDKLSAMSPRVHRLLIASAKGSINSDRSFSSSKDIGGDKSTKVEWKR
ncbi:hypothetical protein Bca52824_071506 [Brassica carinata]|uniref:DUF4005 domain-containing protein n=1 Tax=Brassica carinata TaxID=52824 RepID=A0A8X7Q6U6_BRACI|nr:hypothetical protein Bca52824_071506 [Brassica carinata]